LEPGWVAYGHARVGAEHKNVQKRTDSRFWRS
jgi:hypothetical protein